MRALIKPGDKREYKKVVSKSDLAIFHDRPIHPVCSTFALARDIEWTTRLFVLDVVDQNEEGIGTMLTIDHKGPAFEGEEIIFTGWVDQLNGDELICFYEARVGERLVAIGKTGQRIMKKEKIDAIFKAHGFLPEE